MSINDLKNNNFPTFKARINLCDKAVLKLPHNKELLNRLSPMDFFYNQNGKKTTLDLFIRNIKSNIRESLCDDKNSDLRKNILKKEFSLVNNFSTFINGCFLLKEFPSLYKSKNILLNTAKNESKYIDNWAILGNSIKNKFVDINIEDSRIERIAKLNEPTIFMMNHEDLVRDRFVYSILNSFLNYAYAALGLQSVCPRPYVIVSKNVVKNAGNDTMRKIFEKMGLVSVDASLYNRNKAENVKPIQNLVDKFNKKKANIFIFPEGNNAIFKEKSLKERFQLGFCKTIKKIFAKQSRINIVPIGISYTNEKNSFGKLYIGEPLLLTNTNDFCKMIKNKNIRDIGNLESRQTLEELSDILADCVEECITKSKKL